MKGKAALTAKRTGRLGIWAIIILTAVILLTTWWLLRSAQITTEASVDNLSRLYLEELTTQQANQFTYALDSQIRQLKVTLHVFEERKIGSGEELQIFIGRMKEKNDFDFLALVDEQGMVYTEDSVFPAVSQFSFLGSSLTEPVVSFNQSMKNRNLVLIAVPMEQGAVGENKLFAAMVGINADTIAADIALDEGADGRFFSNVVMPDGSYVVRSEHNHMEANSNLLSALEKKAKFQEEGALEKLRADFKAGKAGMVSYDLQGVIHYTYYMPLTDTGWFIATTLHYDLISDDVDDIRTTLTRNSMGQLAAILLVLTILFLIYLYMRKSNDSLYLEKMRAEESNKAKSAFLSNMSHDIRTPMNAVIGFTDLAIKNVEDPVKTGEYLEKIRAAGNHLLALINDVLEMSRIESGKIRLDEAEYSLPDMLHELGMIILGQIQNKQLELVMDAVGVVDEKVYCDKLRMNQVLLNLLSNAVKFTPAGGKISVRVEQMRGAPEGYGSYVFRVKDTGIGMTPEFVKNLFTPFERERTSTVSGIQGTGLGMAITKNIVDLMGRKIEVVTAPGRGTEFLLRVNLRIQKNRTENVRMVQLENVRALVVDDDFDACDAAVRMLAKLGMQPEWTMSGKEAVLRAKQAGNINKAFGVYLIDWRLPDLGGIEVARQIRQLVGSDAPILIMTAYDWTQIEKEAKEAGVNAFCSKPVFMSELQEALSRAMGLSSEAQLRQRPEDGSPDFAGKRILLVEDNELNREIGRAVLEEAGFGVDEAEDGSAAVERLRASEPGFYDCVLMDIQMPVMDGYEAARAIRSLENRQLADIPIIAMTANAFEEDKKAALDAGMDAHIAKPLDTAILFRVLSKMLV